MKGIRLPSLFLQLSDILAIQGSVTASTTLPQAVMRPMTVNPINVALVTNVIMPLSVESGR